MPKEKIITSVSVGQKISVNTCSGTFKVVVKRIVGKFFECLGSEKKSGVGHDALITTTISSKSILGHADYDPTCDPACCFRKKCGHYSS